MDSDRRQPPLARVALGSGNPLKRRAAEEVLREVEPAAVLHSVAVESAETSQQPLTDEETIGGALRRAGAALAATPDAAVGIGVESGLHRLDGVLYASTWAVVLDREGRRGTGSSGRVEIPGWLEAPLGEGLQLKEAIRRVTGIERQGEAGGVLGLVTEDRITRHDAVREAVLLALAAWRGRTPGGRPREVAGDAAT